MSEVIVTLRQGAEKASQHGYGREQNSYNKPDLEYRDYSKNFPEKVDAMDAWPNPLPTYTELGVPRTEPGTDSGEPRQIADRIVTPGDVPNLVLICNFH
ncbi:hypothetical protein CSUB01_02741 [Colletotrichum sublineola]|uniref:Uncharacterized protein n=1 Tax=Colletotrichum sublineola TaxID=1173701 RepID=A0A066X4T2_COLSU|nr:hypothetical protein CSUB01_02741 [Colletotrichum sublineola]